jgi:hypothetical protein
MIEIVNFTIPAKTPERLPLRMEFKPLLPILAGINVLFKRGWYGAVACRFYDWGSQIVPLRDWINDDDKTYYWRGNRVLTGSPYMIVIEGYNLAVDFEHTLQITFDLIRRQ